MMDLILTRRYQHATMIAAMLTLSGLQAAEPFAAPPAPIINDADEVVAPVALGTEPVVSGLLAPTATDSEPVIDEEIVPAGRRAARGGQGAYGGLAPMTINGEPNYMPGLGGTIYPVTPGEVSVDGVVDGTIIYPQGRYRGDEAAVRISDRPAEMVGPNPPTVKPSNRISPECRFCPHGLPYHECQECDPPAQMVRRYVRRHGVRYPADYGWSPPALHPIDRVSIDYYRAFPAQWTGQAQAAPPVMRPSVYMPTDTTQLGYTYQHSPRWMPYPNMVPPVPHPAQWNIPLYGQYAGACGPVPVFKGNGGEPLPETAPVPTEQEKTNWTPTDVTQTAGRAAPPAPTNLTPVPF